MNVQSLFGGASIGKDMSGNFKLSFKGLAVRAADGKFVAKDDDKFLDVTDLTFDGTESFVYRLPVPSVTPGDVVVISDTPFAVMFVQHVADDGELKGYVPQTSTTECYVPTVNMLNVQFFVKVVSLLDGFGEGTAADSLLPLLLLSNKGTSSKSDDSLTTLLVIQAFGGKTLESNSLLPLLLLMENKSDGLETLLLLQGIGGSPLSLGNLFGTHPTRQSGVTARGKTAKTAYSESSP